MPTKRERKHPTVNKRFCDRQTKPGKYRHIKGLFFEVKPTGSKHWTYRYRINGKDRHFGIGPYPKVDPDQAVIEAGKLAEQISGGIDPLDPIEPVRAVPTFEEAANDYIDKRKARWKSDKTEVSWRGTIANHTKLINDKPIDQITFDDCVEILETNNLWEDHHDTATKVRNRIELIWSAAMHGHNHNLRNPAVWKDNLEHKLSNISKTDNVKPFRHINWKQMPELVADVKKLDGDAARALLWTLMTASRSKPVRLMQWKQIDLEKKVWTVPATNMKGRKGKTEPHDYPITQRMIDWLGPPGRPDHYVFLNREKNPLSEAGILSALKRATRSDGDPWYKYTVIHGFRHSFATWSESQTNFPRIVLRKAMAHTTADKVEETYFRSKLIKQRRRLTKQWVKFLGVIDGHSNNPNEA